MGNDLPADHAERVARAKLALNGVSLGDAFGERFFGPLDRVMRMIEERTLPRAPWRYTDDTVMALSIFEVLEKHGGIDQDALAKGFGAKYLADPNRGYGAGAHRLLAVVGRGVDWRVASRGLFGGSGSFGNGGAMRVAPVGAYFAGDLDGAAAHARRSAEVTHGHAEGQAGAIAVAVAAAHAASGASSTKSLFEVALEYTPRGETRRGIEAARGISPAAPVESAARLLGSGADVTAQDTVPFVLWCAARHIDDFEESMWATVSGLGDRDTTCAMVGGIVALADGGASIPSAWFEARESLGRMAQIGVTD